MKTGYYRLFINLLLISLLVISFQFFLHTDSQSTVSLTIDETQFHCTVLKDGKLEVLYTITFTEYEHRDIIRSIGEFPEPMTILESWGESDGIKFKVIIKSIGNGYYSAVFDRKTASSKKYSVNISYRVDKEVFSKKKYSGMDYSAFSWLPVQWDLPVKKQTVRIITPAVIPDSISKAEQVTEDVVNKTGIISDSDSSASNDRWLYYPSQLRNKNYLSIFAEKSNLPPKYRHKVSFSIPVELVSAGAGDNVSSLYHIKINSIDSFEVLINDITNGSLYNTDINVILHFLGILLSAFLLLLISNPIFILIEILLTGIPVFVAGKLLKVDLYSRIFFPSGRRKFSFTSGLFFSINSLFIPLRICLYVLSGIAALLLRFLIIHPAIKKLFEKTPEYIAPEILIETFKSDEAIDDMNPVETALFLKKPSRCIFLVVMELFTRGYIDIVSGNPLRMAIIKNPGDGLASYERQFIASISSDGTLDKRKIPLILKKTGTSIQSKIWKGDMDKTAKLYLDKIERHWKNFNSLSDTGRRRDYFIRNSAWIAIHDSFTAHAEKLNDIIKASGTSPNGTLFFSKIADDDTTGDAIKNFLSAIVEDVENFSASGVGSTESLFKLPIINYDEHPSAYVSENILSFSYNACHSACHSACVSGF